MAKKIHRRTFLSGAAGVTAAATIGMPYVARGAETLVINSYGGSFEKFMRSQIIPGFEKETGVEVKLDIGLTKAWIANLRAAGPENPPYDVLMFNSIWAALAKSEGFFEAIPESEVPNMKDLYSVARFPNNDGVVGWMQPVGLAYRPDMVKTPPTSYKDLWDNPEFRDKTGLYTITNTAGMMFLLMIAKVYGGSEYNTDVAFSKIKELKPFKQVDFSGSMEVMLTRGEINVGLLDFPAVARIKNKGGNMDVGIPEEGMFMFDQVFNVLKGSKNKAAGYKWINYILRPDVQAKWVKGYFVSPSNRSVEVADEVKHLIPIRGEKIASITGFDWKTANQNRDKVIDRWNKEMS